MTRISFQKISLQLRRATATPLAVGVCLAGISSLPVVARATPSNATVSGATAPAHLARSTVAGGAPASAISSFSHLASQRAEREGAPSATPTRPIQAEMPATVQVQVTIAAPGTPIAAASEAVTAPKIANAPKTNVAPKASGTQDEQEKLLLAQLDADLKRTEKRLDTTSEKLSAGQKELMSLNSMLQAVMDESGADASGLHPFVRVASRYAGTPYVWGGESRYGFDCSGFIIRVMRDLGYKALPHSAAEQFKYGTPVAQSLLKPGDIVFFANTYKPGISHVGIYIGKRRFIHAASTRQGTIISSLDASPYKQKYAGARRLLDLKKGA